MEDIREEIGRTLTKLKTFLAQESVPRLSEADTKAHFIEPILAALGWTGFSIRREYYVKNSQEFIDYALFGADGQGTGTSPVLAIEAKALQADLTEKYAAQLIQYCAVEGVEWAALTNARELQFFNTFLRPDLAAKRVMRLDLLAFNNDEEFDVLFQQLWQLSRESITTASVRTWLNQLRLDKAVREAVLNPGSSTIRHLGRILGDGEVHASPQELVQWFRTHLMSPIPRVQGRTLASARVEAAPKAEPIPEPAPPPMDPPHLTGEALVDVSIYPSAQPRKKKAYYGITLGQLVNSGILPAGTPLILVAGGMDVARAEVDTFGEILWQGVRYRSLSDRVFSPLLGEGRVSFNGWICWYAELPNGRVLLADLRNTLLARLSKGSSAEQRNVS